MEDVTLPGDFDIVAMNAPWPGDLMIKGGIELALKTMAPHGFIWLRFDSADESITQSNI